MPAGAGGAGAPIDHTRAIVVMVPLDAGLLHGKLDPSRPLNELTNPDYRKLMAPYYGRTLKGSLFVDSSSIQLYQDLIAHPGPKVTMGTQLRDKYAAWDRGKTDTRALYAGLLLALESGFIRETVAAKDGTFPPDAMRIAQDLLTAAADKKEMTAEATRFVTAWGKIADALKRGATQPTDAELWKARLASSDDVKVRTNGFYSVIAWDSPEDEINRRLKQLNDNLYAHYLLAAVRGIDLPVPSKPFVVVLAPDGKRFNGFRPALDGLPSQTDGYYSPEHDLLVLAPQMMDPVGLSFLSQNQRHFVKGFSRDRLLNGEIPKLDAQGVNGPKPEEVARASTLAFVEKLAVDDAEIAAVSREGTRQLLFATGELPRHVTLPNWLTQGALNSYTRPHGPAYVTIGAEHKPYMTVAFSTGYGVPNYVLHRYFKEMGDEFHKELNPSPAKMLELVLTDAYFTGLKDAIDPDPPSPIKKKTPEAPRPMAGGAGGAGEGPMPMGPMPAGPAGFGLPFGPGGGGPAAEEVDPVALQRKKRERLSIKAQATAWALYYYLAKEKPAELKEYIAELNKLPRDLPIDGRTSYAAFIRVFKLSSTENGPADPKLMEQFAKKWLDDMSYVTSRGLDVPLVIPEPPKGQVVGPMGIPMPGGPRQPGQGD
jgi:hypothetical protein